MAKILDYQTEAWHCTDKRLPKNEDIMREPPESSFVLDIVEHGQVHPILMCHNNQDGWFLAFGRRRLLAIRLAYENKITDAGGTECDGMVFLRIGEGLTRNDGHIFSLIENAQRNDNPVSDYLAIRELIHSKAYTSYQDLATALHMSVSYVRRADEKYARVPTWALEGVLDGNIAQSVVVGIGNFPPPKQREAKSIFLKNGKITGADIRGMRQAIQQDKTVEVVSLSGMEVPTGNGNREYFNREELISLQVLLNDGKYAKAKGILTSLLSEKE